MKLLLAASLTCVFLISRAHTRWLKASNDDGRNGMKKKTSLIYFFLLSQCALEFQITMKDFCFFSVFLSSSLFFLRLPEMMWIQICFYSELRLFFVTFFFVRCWATQQWRDIFLCVNTNCETISWKYYWPLEFRLTSN